MMPILIVSFLASVSLVYYYIEAAKTKGIVDHPNERSSHVKVTPRGGGIVFVGVWCIAVTVLTLTDQLGLQEFLTLVPGAIVIAITGFIDDLRNVSSALRAAVHLGVSLGVVSLLGGMSWGIVMFAIVSLAIAWSINLYNFMDGTDGFAGVEGVFVLVVGGMMLWKSEATGLAISAWALASAVTGFLIWNWPKSKIFMGDVGSGFLGFLVATYAALAHVLWSIPAVLWVIGYGLFFFDASVTLFRRIFRGERWYAAHRSHAYQRLYHKCQWSHLRILLSSMFVNGVLACLSWWAYLDKEKTWIASGLALGLLAGCYIAIELFAPMERISSVGQSRNQKA